MEGSKKIYLAGGCFWGTQHFLRQIHGVVSTKVGYANSLISYPDYKTVCSGVTGAVEAVEVEYLPKIINLERLIQLYFMSIDPTTVNRQGNDVGTQYRTGIYYTDPIDVPAITRAVEFELGEICAPIVTEILPLENFYEAEDYHQDYLINNPEGYCHINPELFKIAREANKYPVVSDEELKQRLTPLQYAVTRESLTEPPFKNEYYAEFRPGIYVDIISGEPLFLSTDKFESGCGWPAFSKPIDQSLIEEHLDLTHGKVRTEVRSRNSESHLGHVFNDGPIASGGQRYCINSASLRFVPKEDMEMEGYGDYLKFIR